MLINCFICYNCALLFLFQGLCKQNLEQDEDEAFKTTDGDLQGFWDLMMIQVEELDASYQGILLDVWPQCLFMAVPTGQVPSGILRNL